MILFKLNLYIGCLLTLRIKVITPRGAEKEEKKTLKVSGRKEAIKARVKINEIKTKKIEKIMMPIGDSLKR